MGMMIPKSALFVPQHHEECQQFRIVEIRKEKLVINPCQSLNLPSIEVKVYLNQLKKAKI
jgi:hypothetical protein